MAVFTKLSDSDFKAILSHYNIGDYKNSEGIAEGVENTNYKLETTKGNFILTVYEKRVKADDLPFFMNLQKKLNEIGFPCPMPIDNDEGKLISKIKDKNFTIVTFLKGKSPKTIGNDEVSEAGHILGFFHKLSSGFGRDIYRPNTMAKSFWIETYSKVKEKAESHFTDLKSATEKAFNLVNKWPDELPKGVIHADFFPDNVLYNQGKISGVIDFYMACNDLLSYDLAIALNSWCFEKDHAFNITKARLMLKAYNKTRKLSEEELENLPVLCIGASLRFLSTRLFDYFNQNQDALVKVKDPREYLEKLKFHLQVRSHTEYGL